MKTHLLLLGISIYIKACKQVAILYYQPSLDSGSAQGFMISPWNQNWYKKDVTSSETSENRD